MTFDADVAYNDLSHHFHERVRRNESLATHSAFGVGGSADVWISLNTEKELIGFLSLCGEQRWPLLIVGNSSNILYADAGVRGIVVQVGLNHYHIENHGDGTALLIAEAGVCWSPLVHEIAALGWGGLEFGVGIPGTLGGAVINNAGAHNCDLGQVLEWIDVLDARGCNEQEEGQYAVPLARRYLHDELDLNYRHSRFRERRRIHFDQQGQLIPPPRLMIEPPEIVTQLGIRLHHEDPQHLQAVIMQQEQKVPQTSPQHTGILFKDPPGNIASHLIDAAGMKEKTSGSAKDVITLITDIHQRVLQQFGVDLEVEVTLHGEWEM